MLGEGNAIGGAAGWTSRLVFEGALVAGKYRLGKKIGAGGMSSVWEATHIALGQSVAVKVVTAYLAESQEFLRRFEIEAEVAVRLTSRHVPMVFDRGLLEDGTPYLVMERLRGETLLHRIHRSGALSPAEAVNVLTQCARALARAHSLGVVHRDVKPDNIYLAEISDEADYVVKLLDFGVAKVRSVSSAPSFVTQTGMLLGTPAYMSPEQARGAPTVDHRSDLFSLALVGYAAFTGKRAFNASSIGDLVLQICSEPLPSLVAARPSLPPSLDAWFRRACAREPDQRFQSATDFIAELVVAAHLPARDGSILPFDTPLPRATDPTLGVLTSRSPVAQTVHAPSPRRNAGVKAVAAALAIGALVVGGTWRTRFVAAPGKTPAPSAAAAPSPAASVSVSAATVALPASTPTAPPSASASEPPRATRSEPAPSAPVGAPSTRPAEDRGAKPIRPPRPKPAAIPSAPPTDADNPVGY